MSSRVVLQWSDRCQGSLSRLATVNPTPNTQHTKPNDVDPKPSTLNPKPKP